MLDKLGTSSEALSDSRPFPACEEAPMETPP